MTSAELKHRAKLQEWAARKRQTTPRMDRHETIVTGRCETFRYYCIVGVSG